MNKIIVDEAVSPAKPVAMSGNIMGAFAVIDCELGDLIKVADEDIERLHKIFKHDWDSGHFRTQDHLLETYADELMNPKRKLRHTCSA